MRRPLALALVLALPIGLAIRVAAQSSPLGPGAEQAAIDYLRATATDAGLVPADVAELAISAGHYSARSGLSYVYIQQRHAGIDVVEGRPTVAVNGRGEVVHAAGALVRRLASPASQHVAGQSAAQALLAGAALVGAVGTPTTPVSVAPGAERHTTFGTAAGTPVTARLVYTALAREGVGLAWELQIPTDDAWHIWLVRLDAASGAELSRDDVVVSEHVAPGSVRPAAPLAFAEAVPMPDLRRADAPAPLVASYTVYPLPYESPNHAPVTPPTDGRTAVPDPSDAVASPFGWHDTDGVPGAEFTITWGNNARAYSDRDDDNSGDPGDSPDGTASLTFDFPLDLTMAPISYTDAAVANLFYWNNIVHDITYLYGFDPSAGNFQVDNYSPASGGGDPVLAEAQDGGDTNNANMATPPDGSPPRMQMYEWTAPTPDIDGDFDAGVVVHEYTHGISNRLTGGAATTACLNNAEQMGEGWSDWYALMLTHQPGDTGPMVRGIGTYVLDQPTTGPGIRTFPYSTDFGENPFTYVDSKTEAIPHGVGSVWATMLWDMTWGLIDALGYDPDLYDATGGAGNQVALEIVTTGMKLQPCSPGFVDGRDAILAADAALYPDPTYPTVGMHHAILWDAFATRGLGWSADQHSNLTNVDNEEAFDVPLPPGTVEVDDPGLSFVLPPGGADAAVVGIGNTNPPGTGEATFDAFIVRMDAPTPLALTGGPDDFGYTFIDSDEPGGPIPAFEDISGTGTPLMFAPTGGFSPDDEGIADVPLPFPFDFYGAPQGAIQVSTNGFIDFAPHFIDTFVNTPLPASGIPNGVVAPFWDDLLAADGGVVFAGMLGDGRFAIQWDDVEKFPDAASSLTFQVILAPDGTIEFQYETMSSTMLASASVGIENLSGTTGLEIAFDEPYVMSDFAVVIAPPIQWVTATPFMGTVAEGTVEPLTVTVDAAGLPEGVYTADLQITTNDPVTAPMLSITLAVTAGSMVEITGPRGWRYLGPPVDGLTVDALAAQNLVRGVPGFYPANTNPTLVTDYDTGTNSWAVGAGAGDVLPLGHAFRWFMTDIDGIGSPAVSESVALPFTLATPLPSNEEDVRVTLDTSGNRWNHLANPFGADLDLTGAASWPGGHGIRSGFFTYDATTTSWGAAPASVGPWEAFRFRARGPRGNGNPRNLDIPFSATLPLSDRAPEPATPALAFRLDARAADGRPLADRMLTLAFDDDASAAFDIEEDVEKFQPPADTYALIGARAGSAFVGHDARPFAPAEIPLALDAVGTAAEMTLSWTATALPAGLPVVLVDLATGAEIDLRTQSAYPFRVAPRPALGAAPTEDLADGDAASDRFVLRIGAALSDEVVDVVTLDAPRPNPSGGDAVVRFGLPDAGTARVVVFDVRGRRVAVLHDGPAAAGWHHARLPAALAAGVYLVRLDAAGAVRTRQATVVR